MISILISVYNSEKLISNLIKSINNQKYKNFEVLIIDDNSQDKTLTLLKKLTRNNKKFKIYKNNTKLGLTKNLNKLIKKSKGEYIARLDDDDYWYPYKLKKQISFLKKNKNIAMVGSQSHLIKNKKKIFTTKFPFKHNDIAKRLLYQNVFNHSSIVIRSKIIKKEIYNKNYFYLQDYELWLRLVKKYKLANINKPLLYIKYKDKISLKKFYYMIKIKLNILKNLEFSKKIFYLIHIMFYIIRSSLSNLLR